MSGQDRPLDNLPRRLPRAWALWAAARPGQVALVLLVYAMGVGMATAGPPLAGRAVPTAAPGPALRGAGALLPVTVAVHYANEYADADTDARATRTPFSGGSGALVRTGLPPAFLGRAAAAATAVAVLAVAAAGAAGLSADAVAVLVVALVAGLAYSLPPVALVRRGVGEAVNAALGGLLLPVYGVAVVATPGPAAVLAPLPFALVVGCNLLATHWADREADATAGKQTLAVRWPPRRIRRAYAALAAGAGAGAVALWVGDVFPTAVALAHVAPVPFLLWGWRTLTRERSPFPPVAGMVALALAATAGWWVGAA